MSEPVQKWLLEQKWLKTLVNERLAKRSGVIGRLFTFLKIGPRQLSSHTIPKILKYVNSYYVITTGLLGANRTILTKYIGSTYGPLNYGGLFAWALFTSGILVRIQFQRTRDVFSFDYQDSPEFWYRTIGMIFPPNYLNNKVSAHYIEINQIYAYEMFMRYRLAKSEILEERAQCSDKEKRTRYITNPNYVYEPLGEDTLVVKNLCSS